jgi:hypothetical protein
LSNLGNRNAGGKKTDVVTWQLRVGIGQERVPGSG